jgi:proteasome lid subunit RPN8/RPN11
METIWEYVKIAKGEMSLIGIVDEITNDDGIITRLNIREVFLPKQKNSGASTDIDDDSLHEIIHELIQRKNGDANKIRCWIHSHADMNCFWSNIDTGTIKKWAPETVEYPTYVISLVVNKKKEYRLRLDVFMPATKYTAESVEVYDNLILTVKDPLDEELFNIYFEQYQENVENIDNILFTPKQQKVMDKAVELCVNNIYKQLEQVAGILLSQEKVPSQAHIRALLFKGDIQSEYRKCLAAKPNVKNTLKAFEFNPADLIVDYLTQEDEAEANG